MASQKCHYEDCDSVFQIAVSVHKISSLKGMKQKDDQTQELWVLNKK